MPLSKDPAHGGSKKDETKFQLYCSYCYQHGKFLSPEIKSAQEMQKFCIKMMKKNGVPGFIAWILTRGVPRLKRWKK